MSDQHEASVRRITQAISDHIKLLFEEFKDNLGYESMKREQTKSTLEEFQQELGELFKKVSPLGKNTIVKFIEQQGGIANIPSDKYDLTLKEIKVLVNE